MNFVVLSFAHPSLNFPAHRTELSVINTLFPLSGRDVVAYGTVAVNMIDIALRRMIRTAFLSHSTSPLVAVSFT
jgi:hypothetical protein